MVMNITKIKKVNLTRLSSTSARNG